MPWERIDIAPDLAAGEKQATRIGDREILVCRISDDYFAVSSRCTHAAWPLVGEPIDGHEILCTLHGARFDLRDGCPTAGPSSKALITYPIERREDGLYVEL